VTLSEVLHWLLHGKPGMSLCGRAYSLRHTPEGATWCRRYDAMFRVFQRSHCRQSFFWHIERQAGPVP